MLKTFNDFLSFATLIVLAVYTTRIFIGSLFTNVDNEDSNSRSERMSFLKDYVNNEDE